ncbi:hypothetical protein ACP70R_011813 [Stipagrostis hirtigluma subsp. patula]
MPPPPLFLEHRGASASSSSAAAMPPPPQFLVGHHGSGGSSSSAAAMPPPPMFLGRHAAGASSSSAAAMSLLSPTTSPSIHPQPPPQRRIGLHTHDMMENSPVATAPEIEGQHGIQEFASGSPSAGTPAVEIVMPLPMSPTTAKRSRVSSSATNARTDVIKRARCAVGSPALRLMSQIALSPSQRRSPTGVVLRNSQASRRNGKSRKLKSVYWKEFEPIEQNGEILQAKCIHCHCYLSGKQSIGTSHLKKHLERCKAGSRIDEMIDKMRAGATPSDLNILEDWDYSPELARKALVRMIVLHELPFSIVEYGAFREFVSYLNPIFKMVSRSTIKLDCMKAFEGARSELSITLDNAQVNNSMARTLRDNLNMKKMMPCEGRLFHVRCAAHVINLFVQEGLKLFYGLVENIRESVKYIRSSPSRKEKFEEIIVQVGISLTTKWPSLDVSTRWNSMYLMLESAYPFRTAFDELKKQDKNYETAPSIDEWERARSVCLFLKVFYDATVALSGSSYPTANLAFHQLWKIKLALDSFSSSEDE